MPTAYGNTFTDLMAGINAAQALDYQRANAQDAANTARAVARIQQRGQEAQLESQRKQQESQTAFALAQLLSQQREAAADRQSLMDRERLRAETTKSIAESDNKARAELEKNRSVFDPRAFSTIAEIEALNNEQIQTRQKAQQLSEARKAALALKKAAQGDKWGPWNTKEYNDAKAAGTLIPESEADARLKAIDAAAATLGLVPSFDGGFVIPALTPIQIPDMLNRGAIAPGTAPLSPAAVTPVTPAVPFVVDPETIPYGNPNPIAPPVMPSQPMGATPDLSDPSMAGLLNFFRRPASAPTTAPPPSTRERFRVEGGNVFRVP